MAVLGSYWEDNRHLKSQNRLFVLWKKNNCRRWLFSLHDFDGNYCKCCNYCNNGNGSTAVQKVGAFKLSTEFNIWMFGLNFLAQYSLNLFPTNFIKERKNITKERRRQRERFLEKKQKTQKQKTGTFRGELEFVLTLPVYNSNNNNNNIFGLPWCSSRERGR